MHFHPPRNTMAALALTAALFVSLPASAQTDATFARVGDVTISRQEYESQVAVAARAKFYHGKTPDAEVVKLRREVGQRLIDSVLLEKEAQRRKIGPDSAEVQKTLDAYDARYASSAEWQSRRTELLPQLRKKLETESVRLKLETAVRDVPQPTPKEVEAYYKANPDKFTEPEQVKISLILLKVDPSSPQSVWDGARSEGANLVKRLRSGADFAQVAQLHSGDPSSSKGGDMGYIHRGMIPERAQEAIDKLKPGEISDAVVLLEGVAIMRLDDRKTAKLNPLASVAERARDLLRRDQQEQAWTSLVEKLRKDASVSVDESVYAAIPSGTAGAGAPTVR
jgi:peptidylprolyl isomerase